MGASFHWTPTGAGKHLDVGFRSHVGEVLEALFGQEPWIIRNGEWLRTLRASESNEEAWKSIERALETTDEIQVWRSW